MNKLQLSLIILLFFALYSSGQNSVLNPQKNTPSKDTPVKIVPAPDLELIHLEDLQRDNQGLLYRIGIASVVNITPFNSGLWSTLDNGDRQWQLILKSPGAEALSFLFETFKIYGESSIVITDLDGKLVHKPLKAEDVESHFRQHAALCFGDEVIITLKEPKYTQASEIFLDRIIYNYRSTGNPNSEKINESEACQINVNCSPVGNNWQDEKRGVARIYVVEGNSGGWCTGSLINNTSQNCKPYFLTALHCGVNASAANMTQWKFYFKYEAPTCTNPSTAGTLDDYFITGCLRIADSGDNGGDSGSDFLLVKLGSSTNEATTITTLKSVNFAAYWNGWDRSTSGSSGGVGIHHPAGDIKKISTFSSTSVSAAWNGNGLPSHWRQSWSSNSNGHGVTEGGSSGSPLFNNQGYIVGTLTGGSSLCSALSSPDYYGKMSYHWTSNGSTSVEQLNPWLDPTNSGVLSLAGSSNPCSQTTGPCIPSISNTCDEFIQNVKLNTINNTSACSTGGYASYTTTSTPLIKGAQYTITVTPAVGANVGQAYADDEIAVWIDYNNDFTFSSSERIAYVLVTSTTGNLFPFSFTVPTSAVTGSVRMRVRISYSGTGASGGAPIDPCAIATYGETEDYTVNISNSNVGVIENALSDIRIFPNPSDDIMTVDLTNVTEKVNTISLVDVTGKIIQIIDVEENGLIKLNVSSLNSGLYYLMIHSENNVIEKKIIRK